MSRASRVLLWTALVASVALAAWLGRLALVHLGAPPGGRVAAIALTGAYGFAAGFVGSRAVRRAEEAPRARRLREQLARVMAGEDSGTPPGAPR